MAKIEGKLLEELRAKLEEVIQKSAFESFKEVEDHYVSNKIGTKDFKKRARWDLLHCTDRKFRVDFYLKVYQGLNGNDEHIDTALKRVTGIR